MSASESSSCKVVCPACWHSLRAKAEVIGKPVACPSCGCRFAVEPHGVTVGTKSASLPSASTPSPHEPAEVSPLVFDIEERRYHPRSRIGHVGGFPLFVATIALAVGLAVGFISGHVLGKTSNQTATNEAVEAAEQAKADLAEELERKTKLQTLLETAESNARNSKRLNEELTAQNAAMKTELVNAKAKRLVPIPANDHSASRQSAKERETERFNSPSKTFDEAMLKLRDLSNILLKEEPEKTANVMKTLSPEYSWTGVMVERIRDGEQPVHPNAIINKMVNAGFVDLIQAYRLQVAMDDQTIRPLMKKIWTPKLSAFDLGDKYLMFSGFDLMVQFEIRNALATNTKPFSQAAFTCTKKLVGEEYFNQMR